MLDTGIVAVNCKWYR